MHAIVWSVSQAWKNLSEKSSERILVRTLSRMLQLQLQAVQGYRYFKNKNRLLKKYFHETNFIFQQMLFSINSTLTIQSLIYEIKTNNGETVAEYFNEDDNSCTSNMTSLDPLLYVVGKIKAINLTGQQQDLLQYSNTNLKFSHLCKEGTIYLSTTYDDGKQNNSFCMHRQQHTNTFQFRQINKFILKATQHAYCMK